MKLIVHSAFDQTSIRHGLGKPEYSYYFVQAAFAQVLETLGTVMPVRDPGEIDAIYDECATAGESCVFLSFTPPHLVPVGLRCPTVPVFAWEFTTIPAEKLDDDPRSDWRHVFARCGAAITLSSQTASLVREAMGADFPVFAVPAPSYERYAGIGGHGGGHREIRLRGYVFDSQANARFEVSRVWPHEPHPAFPASVPEPVQEPVPEAPVADVNGEPEPEPPVEVLPAPKGLRARLSLTVFYAVAWYRDVIRDILPRPVKTGLSFAGRAGYRAYRLALPLPVTQVVEPPPAPAPAPEPEPEPEPVPAPPALPEARVTVSGIVYATVLAPQDGRKNWSDMVSGFVWALRDRPDATLIVKMPAQNAFGFHDHLDGWLQQLAPFRCRVIALYGFLDQPEYEALIAAADYYVNTSSAEGLCLPLMEFLSAGRPALAPDHSAMADYVSARNAFVLASGLEHNVWPHDPRELYTTMRYRLNWETLVAAYEASYALAGNGGYAEMSQAARETMRDFCGDPVVREKLRAALRAAVAPARHEAETLETAEAAE